MSESSPEKKAKKRGAEAVRWLGRLTREHIPFMPGQDIGRYEQHTLELRQRLSTARPHPIRHHKLHNFIASLPKKFPEQHIEDNRVHVIKELRLEPGRNWDSLRLITSALCDDRNKVETAKDIERAAYAGARSSKPREEVYREVAADHKACAWVRNLQAEPVTPGIKEYIVPTEIQGIVIGFSGLGISRMSQIDDAALSVRFYSVPPEN